MLRVALAQINTTVGSISKNAAKILDYCHHAKSQGVDIVVFPELAMTGYPPEDLLHKKHFVDDNILTLKNLAKQVQDIIVVVGFADRVLLKSLVRKTKADPLCPPCPDLYNAAAIISDGKLQHVYHKHALPNYGVFDEKRYFLPGQGREIFHYGEHAFAVNICEDIWEKDGVHREQVHAGAQILFNLSSSPYDFQKLKLREQLLISRARAQHVFICYTNLVGGQDELVFDGSSMIVNPRGKIIARAQEFAEDLLIADLPVAPLREIKTKKAKFIRLPSKKQAILPLALSKSTHPRLTLTERMHAALVLGTRDYIYKNGFQKVLVGLSGGIDSAVVAAIAVDAIGAENVIGISLPSEFNSSATRLDAQKLAENLSIPFHEIPIQEIFESHLKVLKGPFAGTHPNVAEENLQARIRGNILMAFSNKFGWLVLTTGNKSEMAVGYCTLYGDMSGGFAVIKDVPKMKVYEIAALINEKHPQRIPESIIGRAPTAELRHDQKDEDSLPPYSVLDPILEAYVEQHRSLAEIRKAFKKDEALIRKVVQMVDQSEYKRRQAPPGVKVTPRAFGKDWRLPITNRYRL